MHYITTGNGNAIIQDRWEQGLVASNEFPDLSDRTDLLFEDESQLNELLRAAESTQTDHLPTVNVRFFAEKGDPPWLKYETDEGRICYVGMVEARHLAELYKKPKNAIFSLNIRYFVGNTKTNRQITTTAGSEPDLFFFYNNGVSAVATDIHQVSDLPELHCERFSIVNGAQTVRSLHRACSRSGQDARHAKVLMRITKVSLKKSLAERGFLDKVTRFNNTQNAVRVSDFRSNDPIQQALKAKLETLYRGGKQYRYKNKREFEGKLNCIAITLDEFARTVHAFRRGPIDMFGGPTYLYETESNGGYVHVFGDGRNVSDHLDDADFEILAGTWFVCEGVRDLYPKFRKQMIDAEAEMLAENPKAEAIGIGDALTKWLAIYSVGELLRRRYRNEALGGLESALKACYQPKWLDEVNGPRLRNLREYTQLACKVLRQTFMSERKKGAGFTVRKWTRDPKSLEEIKTEIRMSLDVDSLPLLVTSR